MSFSLCLCKKKKTRKKERKRITPNLIFTERQKVAKSIKIFYGQKNHFIPHQKIWNRRFLTGL